LTGPCFDFQQLPKSVGHWKLFCEEVLNEIKSGRNYRERYGRRPFLASLPYFQPIVSLQDGKLHQWTRLNKAWLPTQGSHKNIK